MGAIIDWEGGDVLGMVRETASDGVLGLLVAIVPGETVQ